MLPGRAFEDKTAPKLQVRSACTVGLCKGIIQLGSNLLSGGRRQESGGISHRS